MHGLKVNCAVKTSVQTELSKCRSSVFETASKMQFCYLVYENQKHCYA